MSTKQPTKSHVADILGLVKVDSDPIVDLGLHDLASALATLKSKRHWHYKGAKGTRNRRERTFFVCCDCPLPVNGGDGYFPGHVLVDTNYAGAVKAITGLLQYFDTRGGTLRLKVSDRCFFIGGH